MAESLGKKFEAKVKQDLSKCMTSVDRIIDSVSGYYGVRNICDFIAYDFPTIFYIECKSCHGTSWPFSAFTQYELMKQKVGLPGVRSGVLLWMVDYDVVVYLPVRTITRFLTEGKKSFSVKKHLSSEGVFQIPSTKKVKFLSCDYSMLKDLKDGD